MIPRKLLLLLVTLFFLNLLDAYTTIIIIQLGGREVNPIFHHFNTHGVNPLDIAVKIGAGTFLCAVLGFTHWVATKRKDNLVLFIIYVTAIALNILFFVVVTNNVKVLNYQIQEVWRVLTKNGR